MAYDTLLSFPSIQVWLPTQGHTNTNHGLAVQREWEAPAQLCIYLRQWQLQLNDRGGDVMQYVLGAYN